MKIYISGKISGLPIEEAKALFQTAEDYLLKKYKDYNVEVANPFKLDHAKALALEAIMEHEKDYPEASKTVSAYDVWCAYMEVDVAAVLKSDGIYMLKNWEQSKGARVEYAIAKEIALTISYE